MLLKTPKAPPADANFRYDYQWVGASTGTNTGSYKLVKYPNVVTTDNTDTTEYKVVNGILLFNGQPFSGTYNGQTYENGKVKTTDNGNNNNNLNTDTSDLITIFTGSNCKSNYKQCCNGSC
jgi:hypothetical protein